MAAAGIVLTIAGLAFECPAIILFGAMITVGGAICSFASGALGGSNSDSFLNSAGDAFSSGQEALSQGVRYLANAASTIPGVPGLIATVTGAASGIWDFCNNSRNIQCVEEQNPSQRSIRIASAAIEQFCADTAGPDGGNGGGDNGGGDGGGGGGGGQLATLTGCWELTYNMPGQTLNGFRVVMQISAIGNVERLWYYNFHHGVTGWVEQIRFLEPNIPTFESAYISYSQQVSVDAGGLFRIQYQYAGYGVSPDYMHEGPGGLLPACIIATDSSATVAALYTNLAFDSGTTDRLSGQCETTATATTASDFTQVNGTGTVTGIRVSCPPAGAVSEETRVDLCSGYR